MKALELITQLKSNLAQVNDRLATAKLVVQALQDEKQQIQADIADLQAYITWKQANP